METCQGQQAAWMQEGRLNVAKRDSKANFDDQNQVNVSRKWTVKQPPDNELMTTK